MPTISLALSVDRAARQPLQTQMHDQLRELIFSGRLADGERMPSTRALADELGLSRTTVVAVYDQLAAEGLIETRRGAGAFVARGSEGGETGMTRPPPLPAPSAGAPLPFETGVPDGPSFPDEQWARALARAFRRRGAGATGQRLPGGDPELRAAIAEHLRTVRGLDIEAGQVLITSGMRETLTVIASALIPAGSRIWVEDPCYPAARRALRDLGLAPCAVPVDEQGIRVEDGRTTAPDAVAALVTPSRHYPLGMTLSAARRTALFDWAAEAGALVVEDDYDSEYRYRGRPLAPLFAGDRSGAVIHIGSFSKVMFAGLRLAYLVAPSDKMPALIAAQRRLGTQASIVPQIGLAEFMRSGQFAAHVRRSRRLYRRRQAVLISAVERYLGGLVRLRHDDAGIQIAGELVGSSASDIELSERARGAGIVVEPLSPYYRGELEKQGLVFGFAAFDEESIERAVARLAEVFAAVGSTERLRSHKRKYRNGLPIER